jgi:putative tricarboxylic transport membrane protein
VDSQVLLEALYIVFEPARLLWLMLGVGTGLIVGILPGLGGVVGLALLLPFIYGLDPYAAMAMLIGVGAVVSTSDTFPSILIGTPGSAGSQATIMDGYPLAQKGEAARALSAAFSASMVGGVFGAIVLSLIIPVARPLVLAFGSPELLMLSVLGLTLVGSLSGSRVRNPVKGLSAAAFGLFLGTIGGAPAVLEYRFTFDALYLFEGIGLVLLSLGLFAIPEIVDLLCKGGAIADKMGSIGRGWRQGLRDTLRYRWLVLRHSAIGVLVGFTPGLGSAIVDWLNYGVVVRTSKDREEFGKGDIRGVIAPESANNAKDGGALIPTLLFGIPGSASMAILLGAMTTLGIEPGPRLIQNRPEVLYVIVWSLAIGTVAGTLICFLLSRWIARLALIPFHYVAPFILMALALGAYSSNFHWADLLVLLVFGLLGWLMKHAGVPRAPLLVGFVLSPLIERYLWISLTRYGLSFLLQPFVLVIATITVLLMVWQVLGTFGVGGGSKPRMQQGEG